MSVKLLGFLCYKLLLNIGHLCYAFSKLPFTRPESSSNFPVYLSLCPIVYMTNNCEFYRMFLRRMLSMLRALLWG